MAKRWRRRRRKQVRKHEDLLVKEKLSNTENSHKHDWKKDIKISQDYICAFCGKKGTDSSLDIHHCIPRVKHGSNSKDNCVAVHKQPCHRDYHKKHGVRVSDKHGNPID